MNIPSNTWFELRGKNYSLPFDVWKCGDRLYDYVKFANGIVQREITIKENTIYTIGKAIFVMKGKSIAFL